MGLLASFESPEVIPQGVRFRAFSRLGPEVSREMKATLQTESHPFISLSHTKWPHPITVGAAAPPSIGPIGIDLEWRGRSVSREAGERFCAESDRASAAFAQGGELLLWVIKEAAYKSNPHNLGSVLPQYTVVSERGQGKGDRTCRVSGPGGWQGQVCWQLWGDWWLAVSIAAC